MDEVIRPGVVARRRSARDSEEASTELAASNKDSDAASAPTSSPPLRSSRRKKTTDRSNYSGDWHPMDDSIVQESDMESIADGSDSVDEEKVDSLQEQFKISPGNEDQDEAIDADDKHRGLQSAFHRDEDQLYPDRRKSERVPFSKDLALKYDTKHHPLDSTTRPKQVQKRLKRKISSLRKTQLKLSEQDEETDTLRDDSSPESDLSIQKASALQGDDESVTLVQDNVHNPLLLSLSLDLPALPSNANPYLRRHIFSWVQLSDFYHTLFLLRKGAPLPSPEMKGDATKMHEWTEVKEALLSFGFLTLDQVNSPEVTEELMGRYESLCEGLQGFFNAEEETNNKRDWSVFRAETFDVFDRKTHLRYWKREQDRNAGPIETCVAADGAKNQIYELEKEDNGGMVRETQAQTLDLYPQEIARAALAKASSSPSVRKSEGSGLDTGFNERDSIVQGEENLIKPMEENSKSLATQNMFDQEEEVTLDNIENFLENDKEKMSNLSPDSPIAEQDNPFSLTTSSPGTPRGRSRLTKKLTSTNRPQLPRIRKTYSQRQKRRRNAPDQILIHEDESQDNNANTRGRSPDSHGSDVPVENMVYGDDEGSDSGINSGRRTVVTSGLQRPLRSGTLAVILPTPGLNRS